MVRTDKKAVEDAATIMAKASWLRNKKRRAMVVGKKKREVNKTKRHKQANKIISESIITGLSLK